MVYENGSYTIDFADFERRIVEEDVKLFILCSPHNPVGRVWTHDELQQIGRICQAHGVYVVSDEIHCDFAFPEHSHSIFLKAVPGLSDWSIVCTAPSKTFNLAGLQASNIFIPGGLVACQAACKSGGEWLEQCRMYLRDNLNFLQAFLSERIPQIRLVEPEGTYFAWLDCSGLDLCRHDLNDLIVKRARLWLDAGHIFGQSSAQFQRIVLACPRSILSQALEQLEQAVKASK